MSVYMAIIKARCLLFQLPLWILLNCLHLGYTYQSKEILVSRNHTCHKSVRLSSQSDSYKFIFPTGGSHCDCSDCKIFSTWMCKIHFVVDPFTLQTFQVCVDAYSQRLRNCDTSDVFFEIGSEAIHLRCNVKLGVKCFTASLKIIAVFTAAFPCSFYGFSKIYLQSNDPATYYLFKENRTCPGNIDSHGNDKGTIVSEFDQHHQKHLDSCPVHLYIIDMWKHSKFCFWFEYVKLPMSKFAITISSKDGKQKWIYRRSSLNINRVCERMRPMGYVIYAILDSDESRNNHRIRLRYEFKKEDDDNDSGDDDDDDTDEDEDDDDGHMGSAGTVFKVIWIVFVPLFLFILVFGICYVKILQRRRKQRQENQYTADFSNMTDNNTALSQTDNVTGEIQSGNSRYGQSEVEPHAPLMAESEFASGHSFLPEGGETNYRRSPVAPSALMEERTSAFDPPPSYSTLFPSNAS